MKLFIMLAALLISVPAHASQFCQPATTQQIESLQSILKTKIQNADSARLIDVCVIKRDDERLGAVCGLINAKNKYTAYDGFKPFVARLEPARISIVEDTKIASDEKTRYCEECDSSIYCD